MPDPTPEQLTAALREMNAAENSYARSLPAAEAREVQAVVVAAPGPREEFLPRLGAG